jgi:hypothetical protein
MILIIFAITLTILIFYKYICTKQRFGNALVIVLTKILIGHPVYSNCTINTARTAFRPLFN